MSSEAVLKEIKSPKTTSSFLNHIQTNLPLFIDMIRQVNKIIMDNRKPDMKIEWKIEGDRRSPVTEADIKANEMICNFLIEHFSYEKTVIVSEENKEIPFIERNNMENESVWVIDPLDGTSSYINYDVESLQFLDDGFTVNIARLEKRNIFNPDGSIITKWIPVFGIISTPIDGMIYFGGEGIGSFLCTIDDRILQFGKKYSEKSQKKFQEIMKDRPIRVGLSASYCNDKTKSLITKFFGNNIESFSSGSSMKFINVFLGKTDFYPRLGRTMEWDICAAVAIGESCGFNIKIYDESATLENLDSLNSVAFNKIDLSNPFFIVY